jgi:hypothetical protein
VDQEFYHEVPDGKASIWASLQRVAEIIRDHNPSVADFAEHLEEAILAHDPTLTHEEIAAVVFEWVKAHMHYVDDIHVDPINAPGYDITDELKHPDVLLGEIARQGFATGDCDDYVILLGSLYHDRGYGITLVNVVQRGTEQEHVYLRVATPDGVFAADGIVDEPFGWELPEEDRESESVVPV